MRMKLIAALVVPLIAALTAQAAAASEHHHRQAKGRAVPYEQLLNRTMLMAEALSGQNLVWTHTKALFTRVNTCHRLRMAADQAGPRRRAVYACWQRSPEASCPCKVSRPMACRREPQASMDGGLIHDDWN